MEPRPPKVTRAPNPPYISSPGPVPNSERVPERPAWLDQSPIPTTPPWNDDQVIAEQPGQGGGFPPRGGWYDQTGQQPSMDPMRSPLMPVVSPRGERRARFLGPILALLLVALVVVAGVYAVQRVRDNNDDNLTPTAQSQVAVPTPTTDAAAAAAISPEATTEPAATATPEPTEEPATEAVDPTEESADSADSPDGEATVRSTNFKSADDFLPALAAVPDGFEVTDTGGLTEAEVAEAIGTDGAELLDEWEWRENASRAFEIPAGDEPAEDVTISLTVSVHRFRLPDGAEAGLDGLADVLAGSGYEEVDVDQIGDQTRALQSQSADGNLYVLYVRTSNVMIRLGGFSLTGDPSADVIALAESILESV